MVGRTWRRVSGEAKVVCGLGTVGGSVVIGLAVVNGGRREWETAVAGVVIFVGIVVIRAALRS